MANKLVVGDDHEILGPHKRASKGVTSLADAKEAPVSSASPETVAYEHYTHRGFWVLTTSDIATRLKHGETIHSADMVSDDIFAGDPKGEPSRARKAELESAFDTVDPYEIASQIIRDGRRI
jgi:ribosome maturation protein Sdo1